MVESLFVEPDLGPDLGPDLEPEESPLLEDFNELEESEEDFDELDESEEDEESEEDFDELEESEEEELPLSPVLDFPSVVLDPPEDSDFMACLRDSDG